MTTRRKRQEIVVADAELAQLQQRYRALLEEISRLGFIATGSVIERYSAPPPGAAATLTRLSGTARTTSTAARSPARPSPSD
jgi:hypothetical protein